MNRKQIKTQTVKNNMGRIASGKNLVDVIGPKDENVLQMRFDANQFPASAAFVYFLDKVSGNNLIKDPEDRLDWGDQVTERMNKPLINIEMAREIREASDAAFNTEVGKYLAAKAYSIFSLLLLGDKSFIGNLHLHDRFILLVTAPRHGGSYLTKELYRAVGVDHKTLPASFAHDGFPDATLQWVRHDFLDGSNMIQRTIQQTAEWLTMADWYFRNAEKKDGLRNIPKKGTKMIFAAPFFREILGPAAEWIVAARHPASACLSLLDKAGGMPADGKFPLLPRSSIERYVLQSWLSEKVLPEEVARMDYFDAFLHYWKRYYQTMAFNGLFIANNRLRILPYEKESFEGYLREQHARFDSGLDPEPMFIKDRAKKEVPEWVKKSAKTLEDIGSCWQEYQVVFPIDIVSLAL